MQPVEGFNPPFTYTLFGEPTFAVMTSKRPSPVKSDKTTVEVL
ncbi:MAG: hypothetical protein AMQ74_00360 [Candidatus Methanofastidiosum methylothiophilum]|uniref:Uncharacterized protein n=1 Tax=Candidatus Methanofastidiosum methylothiophilum TaxID=1705564 RepID=A0A150J8C2_9EURY|nr:MAG: hypothetical protein AMQ74_00360 [Candidatus Methanofastidiosum methylthiophilus]